MRPTSAIKLLAFLALIVVALALSLGQGRASGGDAEAIRLKISDRVLSDTANGKQASFTILLNDQADLSRAYGMEEDARGWYVYRTLKRHAARTQAPIRAMLEARNIPYRAHYVANVIFADGDRSDVETLAARSDVSVIEPNAWSNWLTAERGQGNSPETIEPGVNQVKAPNVWALGFNGTGIVIGNQDTGVRWTHNALKPHYRGWDGSNANHNYNWWDAIHVDIPPPGANPCGLNSQVPCDDNSHGTHTTGTTSGDDGNPGVNQIGVAPGAKWIGCRNMDQDVGRPETYTECFEFFIAPWDLNHQNPNPTLRPHVMNNSWGCPTSELCAEDTLRTIIENTTAAGIFVNVSAGNSGPNCSTVNTPPSHYAASYSTGALITGTQTLVGFSSRGPVTVDGSNRIKPDIVAPGASTRSSTNASDSSYASFQGTSMASPHVVGVVALLWQAVPSLSRDIAATKARLNGSANPNITVTNGTQCGGIGSIPNNHFGYGLVDALNAVQGGGRRLLRRLRHHPRHHLRHHLRLRRPATG